MLRVPGANRARLSKRNLKMLSGPGPCKDVADSAIIIAQCSAYVLCATASESRHTPWLDSSLSLQKADIALMKQGFYQRHDI